ncbi:sporulation integral membrane protein YtvI [Hydrogenoanaerobacterium sp.]|uniref:sporulation integral membrane protein YtvI n=1 Tax=Hydrogenoanaerobacterium sp. TaxID=2953763 RepID=UPI002899058F|nr:sporulation integral membrane protein YtvI [Hydrogenoanaerobacterium sp.]
MTLDGKLKFLVNTLYTMVVLALTFFVLKYLIWWLLPLVLGFLIAFALKPVVNAVYRMSSATRRFCAIMVLLCAYTVLFALLWLVLLRLITGLRGLFISLPQTYNTIIAPSVTSLSAQISALLEPFFPELGAQFANLSDMITEQLGNFISGVSDRLIESIGSIVKAIPAFMLTFLFTILSSFFISMDYTNVVSFLARLVPKQHRKTLFALKDFLVTTVFKYAKAYLLLLLITFTEVWAGLGLLRVPGSIYWAVGIAVADLLPAIGTGLILIPWSVLSFAQGDKFLGIGLLALYGVITVVRNLIEPKIVGDNIGLPPLVIITSMFFGLKLFGAVGMFLAPIFVLILKFLNDTGRVHLWEIPPKQK